MTARVRRPLVASISLVLPLALSMSRFTGSESRATMATICSATTTLPCPTFIRCTATPLLLLKVLDLLAHLLEHTLARQRGLAQLQVVGLAGHRVHLATQLLEQEIQRAADGAAVVQHQRQLGQVGAQPRQLLGDVGLVGPHGRLGQDARLVDGRAAQQRANALAQPLLAALGPDRRPHRHRLHDRAQLGVQAAQVGHQPPALPPRPRDQPVERAPSAGGKRMATSRWRWLTERASTETTTASPRTSARQKPVMLRTMECYRMAEILLPVNML